MSKEGYLQAFEIFLFTDNLTVEINLFNGSLKSETFFGLALQFFKMYIAKRFQINLSYISIM